MDRVLQNIKDLFFQWKQQQAESIELIPQSGSDRMYFRLFFQQQSFIATYNLNTKENEVFIYFSRHFASKQLPVPEVFCVNDDTTIYIQEDVGTENLLSVLEKEGQSKRVYELYQKSLYALAYLQINGDKGFDYNNCFVTKEFGKQAILNDLLYFKYYFLDTLCLPYNRQALQDDFETLSNYLSSTEYQYFMFRDFQSRNILVKNDEVFFIDFQGGMKGALQYDVASLLWQAKANLSNEWKNKLLEYYISVVNSLLDKQVDTTTFINQYNGYVLIRLLQVLGAYGFRGLFERKHHFVTSIPYALNNLKFFIGNNDINIATPELASVLQAIVSDDIIQRFTPLQANEQTALMIKINSFSYRKGIPTDESGNGGGFVFDMRGILNPGRFDDYKHLSGKDKPVQDFLEQKTRMNEFLTNVWSVIDVTVEDYLQRGFDSLMINFGCTGGQHRSVYAAEQTAKHLSKKYKLKIVLKHTNEKGWVTEKQ